MKIVINKCYGGFGISHKAIMRHAELAGFELYPFYNEVGNHNTHLPYTGQEEAWMIHYSKKPLLDDGNYEKDSYWSASDIERNDEFLIQVIEELGHEADGSHAELAIVEIPDGVDYEIDEYDGIESIHETHRTWY